jgi:hypothetical protein
VGYAVVKSTESSKGCSITDMVDDHIASIMQLTGEAGGRTEGFELMRQSRTIVLNFHAEGVRSDPLSALVEGERHSVTMRNYVYVIAGAVRMCSAPRPASHLATRVFESLELCMSMELEAPVAGSAIHSDPFVKALGNKMPSHLAEACNLGHIILSDRANYDRSLATVVNFDLYNYSLGGADDIYDFGEAGVVAGCPIRTRRLRVSAGIGKPSVDEYKLLRRALGLNPFLMGLIKPSDRATRNTMAYDVVSVEEMLQEVELFRL